MTRRFAGFGLLVAGSVAALAILVGAGLATAQTDQPRTSFVVATGSSGGTYFPIGQALSDIVSHPPGVARCDTADVCGPSGLIASARTSDGAIANVLDVNAHRVDAALVQSDVVADAVAGKGAFKKFGPQSHIRIIADLFPEEVHVVAARGAHIASIQDLKGKRVSIGVEDSGTIETARTLLAAYRIPERRIKESNDPPDIAAQKLQRGQLDGFVFVGGAPVMLVESLIARGQAVLIPVDGAGRKRLLAEAPSFSSTVITSLAYPASPAVQTVAERAIWIVNDSEPADLVYGVTKALFNPANRALLDNSHPSAKFIRLQTAIATLPAPLHPGAARFYREVRVR
jgi:uncharacterized protein